MRDVPPKDIMTRDAARGQRRSHRVATAPPRRHLVYRVIVN